MQIYILFFIPANIFAFIFKIIKKNLLFDLFWSFLPCFLLKSKFFLNKKSLAPRRERSHH
jgi:hypothetical protein